MGSGIDFCSIGERVEWGDLRDRGREVGRMEITAGVVVVAMQALEDVVRTVGGPTKRGTKEEEEKKER